MPSSLLAIWPRVASRLDSVPLGDFPTPVERLAPLEAVLGSAPLYVKRDDRSSPVYGGNKVRTLEVLFGRARAEGAREIVSTGAFGSNHAVATVLHAPRAGLVPGAMLFPQPVSFAALENVRVTLAHAVVLRVLRHWIALPFAIARERTPERSIMVPGGATPYGALGYVAAALELAEQVHRGVLEPPTSVVVGVGSTCTSAGLLVGLAHAARLGIGFRTPPRLVSVRVTPWPVTARFRILGLAERCARLLAELAGDARLALSSGELAAGLSLDGKQLGAGYGKPSASGREALATFRDAGLFPLDVTYSSKAAAGLFALARAHAPGPLLFWSTKSTVPLPEVAPEALRSAPATAVRWMLRAERTLSRSGELPGDYARLVRSGSGGTDS